MPLGPDDFTAGTDTGLNLSAASASAPDLGIAPSVSSAVGSNVQDTPRRLQDPIKSLPGRERFGLALQDIGGLFQGRSPRALANRRNQLLQQRQGEIKALTAQFDLGNKIVQATKNMPKVKRNEFIDKTLGSLGDDDFTNSVKLMADQPDLMVTLPEWVQKDQFLSNLMRTNPKSVIKFINSKQGQKRAQRFADKKFQPQVHKKIPLVMDWFQKNKPDLFKVIQKDGHVSVSELQSINLSAPENLRMSTEEMSNATAPRNQKALIQHDITTDEVFLAQAKGRGRARGAIRGEITSGPRKGQRAFGQIGPGGEVKTARGETLRPLPSAVLERPGKIASRGQRDAAMRIIEGDPTASKLNVEDQRNLAVSIVGRAKQILRRNKGMNTDTAMRQALREADVKPGKKGIIFDDPATFTPREAGKASGTGKTIDVKTQKQIDAAKERGVAVTAIKRRLKAKGFNVNTGNF